MVFSKQKRNILNGNRVFLILSSFGKSCRVQHGVELIGVKLNFCDPYSPVLSYYMLQDDMQ